MLQNTSILVLDGEFGVKGVILQDHFLNLNWPRGISKNGMMLVDGHAEPTTKFTQFPRSTMFKAGDKVVINTDTGGVRFFWTHTFPGGIEHKEIIWEVPKGTVMSIMGIVDKPRFKTLGKCYNTDHPKCTQVYDKWIKPYENEEHPCNCSMIQLMNHGCRCEGI